MNPPTTTDIWSLVAVAVLTAIAAFLAAAETGLTRMSRASANLTSRSAASALMMPPPVTIRGRSASASMSNAFSTCARVAVGLYTGSGW